MRVKILTISYTMLMAFIRGRQGLSYWSEVPATAYIVRAIPRPTDIQLIIEDPSFEELPEGGVPAELNLPVHVTDYEQILEDLTEHWR